MLRWRSRSSSGSCARSSMTSPRKSTKRRWLTGAPAGPPWAGSSFPWPGLITTAIFSIIFTWNEFLMGLFIVTTAASQTVPVGASGLLTMDRSIEWNVTSTVGVVTVVPVLLFSLLVQRHIVRGLTAGAVK